MTVTQKFVEVGRKRLPGFEMQGTGDSDGQLAQRSPAQAATARDLQVRNCTSYCVSSAMRCNAACTLIIRQPFNPRPHIHSPPVAMLQRRLAYTTSRLLLNGQGAALCQGFARSSQQEASLLPPSAAAVVAGPAQLPSLGGLRWHSDLAERKEGKEQPFVYEGPFATAVTRVKVSRQRHCKRA